MAVPNLEDFDPDFASPAQWAAMYRAFGLQVIPGWMPGERKGTLEAAVPVGVGALAGGAGAGCHVRALVRSHHRRAPPAPQHGDHRAPVPARSSSSISTPTRTRRRRQWWNDGLPVDNNGIDLETLDQQTGGGGSRSYFARPLAGRPDHQDVDRRRYSRPGRLCGAAAVLHESGKTYEWLPGRAPWEMAIEDAPAWLFEAIDELVEVQRAPIADPQSGPKQAADPQPQPAKPQSGSEYDEFGHRIDGREQPMRDMVWHCVLKLYRPRRSSPPAAWRSSS